MLSSKVLAPGIAIDFTYAICCLSESGLFAFHDSLHDKL